MDIVSSEAETLLLNDVVQDSVDFGGRPALRSEIGCWKSAVFVIGAQVTEEFVSSGILSNLISFLTGPLCQSTAAAAANVNVWSGVAMLMPLLGGFVADSFLGRYRTIVVASLIYALALGLLSLSATLHPSNSSPFEKTEANSVSLQHTVFFFALYLDAFAQGGHKACLQAFGADQFDEHDKRECKAKSSFFNWWCFTMSASILLAQSILTYVQDNLSWELGFGIPCIVMCFSLIVFLLGSKTYRYPKNNDGSSPVRRIGRVFVKASRNWNTQIEYQGDIAHQGVIMKFLDKALVSEDNDPNSFSNINDVENAKALVRLLPIFCTCLGFTIVYQQTGTLFTKQGAAMDRRITVDFQIPAASMQALIGIAMMVFVPIYDLLLVPLARAITKKPAGISVLQRVGLGLFSSVFAMAIAAIVENQRLKYGSNATVPMSVWWLVPQYVLMGVANVLANVGLQEFFYGQVPRELRSIGLGLNYSVYGIGSFLSGFLISIVENATSGDMGDGWFSNDLNQVHLDYFYWLLAGLSAFALALYIYFAKSYVYIKNE